MLGTLNLEQEFLNHLIDRESLGKIIKENPSVDIFEEKRSREAIEFVLGYVSQSNKFPTPEVLKAQFPDVEFADPVSSVEWIIEQLKTRYQRGKLYKLVQEVAVAQENPAEGLKILREGAAEIESTTLSHKNIWNIKEDFGSFIEDIKDDIIKNGTQRGYSLGFREIDLFTGGLKPGRLGFFAARPKRQKTMLMIKSFIEQIKQGHHPVFFTLELLDKEILLRMMCFVTGFPWDKAERGNIVRDEWKMIEEGWSEFSSNIQGSPMIVMPKPGERSVPQMVMMADKLNADSIFISQLKQIESIRYYKNTFDKYNEIVTDLKSASTRSGSERPILVEAQFNRTAQSLKEMGEMDLAQLGLTDAIGQTSDVVFGVVQNQEDHQNQLFQFGIIEARNHGKQGWVFQYEYQTKTEIRCIGIQ